MKRPYGASLLAGMLLSSLLFLSTEAQAQHSRETVSITVGNIAGTLDLCGSRLLASELIQELSSELDVTLMNHHRRKKGGFDGTRARCGSLISDIEEFLEDRRSAGSGDQG